MCWWLHIFELLTQSRGPILLLDRLMSLIITTYHASNVNTRSEKKMMVMLIMMMKMMKHCWYNPLLNEDVQINIFDKNKMMHFQGCTNNKKRYSKQEFEFCLSKYSDLKWNFILYGQHISQNFYPFDNVYEYKVVVDEIAFNNISMILHFC